MNYELLIASRHLRSKRRTGFVSLITYISVFGVMIGVAALIIVLSVMNGFESEVRSRIVGFDAHVRVGTYHDRGIEDYGQVIRQIQDIPHTLGISPYIVEKGLIRSAESSGEGLVVKGVDPETVVKVSDLQRNIVYGKLDLGMAEGPEGERPLPGIVLGFNLADKLVVGVGDKVTIISPVGVTGMFGPMPPVMQFRVTGYFQTGLYQYDDTFAYISLESAQKLFKMGQGVTGLELRLDNLSSARWVAQQIDSRLGYPYRTTTWFDMNRNLFSWMQIEKWAAFIVLSLIIMVAAFNIASTLIMIVLEKTKEIGILKSMGATAQSIMKIFVFEGLITGVVGTVLGCVAGYVLCWSQLEYKWFSLPGDVYIINFLPVLMRWTDFVWVSLAAILISYLATLYPAWKASRLDPVQAIRYE
ncbi:MAG: lipoprotein-releasing ABC transporter permease subunit [bacterium]|jgi:lipoprotein-releasing system permease protein|nr:lipoprotein-releasing ABC transporter permease subunit [candidate division KSB1 bacterium]MDH7560667.1 lipoprotein-releasing ABC transporter permease subunit [bacterium]